MNGTIEENILFGMDPGTNRKLVKEAA